VAAALPISGLAAWQGLFDHAHLTTGQTVLIHGAAGGVGSIAVQLAREVGARVIGTGRADDRDVALGLGAQTFLDLDADDLQHVGEVDVVFDVIGRNILERSTELVRPGGTRVTIAMPPTVQPKDGKIHLLRRRTRPRPADRPRPAPPGRTAQPHSRRRATAFRDGFRVRPPPPHARQDDHSGRGRTRSAALLISGSRRCCSSLSRATMSPKRSTRSQRFTAERESRGRRTRAVPDGRVLPERPGHA
jgi:hypothetical protein